MSRTIGSEHCRVGVQFEADRLDFTVPADLTVAAVIPSIVDHVGVGRRRWQEVPACWQLSRVDGRPLSSRASLRDNDVRDGDILWLSHVPVADASPTADDAIAQIMSSLDAVPRWTPTATRAAASIVTVCCAALAAYALLRSPSSGSPVVAGLLSAVALTAAVAAGRVYRDTSSAVTLGACSAALASVAAYLAVPGGATAPKLMLVGAVCATVSVLAARYVGTGAAGFTGVASFGFLSAAAACVRLIAPVGVAATGAVLAAAATGLLVVCPRLAIWAGRLPIPPHGSRADDARHVDAIITGLACGSSAAAALGAALAVQGSSFSGAAFAAAIGVTLVLRAGTHVDLAQVAALLLSGTTCFAVIFTWAVGMWPQHAHWIALGAAVIAAGSAASSSGAKTASPPKRRCVELTEYAALASVVPLACWVCGVFAAVRGVHLS